MSTHANNKPGGEWGWSGGMETEKKLQKKVTVYKMNWKKKQKKTKGGNYLHLLEPNIQELISYT